MHRERAFGLFKQLCNKGLWAGITLSTGQTFTFSNKMVNICINVILWRVRVMFIPPRLSCWLDTISLCDGNSMEILCCRKQKKMDFVDIF